MPSGTGPLPSGCVDPRRLEVRHVRALPQLVQHAEQLLVVDQDVGLRAPDGSPAYVVVDYPVVVVDPPLYSGGLVPPRGDVLGTDGL